MAKTPSTKRAKASNNSKSKKQQFEQNQHPIRSVLLVGLATLLILVTGNYAYDLYLDHQDRQRFETVRQSVETLHKRLQANAGAGEAWRTNVFCTQGSTKADNPNKTCHLKTDVDIEVSSEKQAKASIKEYSEVFRQSSDLFKFDGEGSAPTPPSFPAGLKNGYDGAGYRERETNMVCGTFFTIDDRFKENKAQRLLELNFSCKARAREHHYPRADV